MRAARTEASEPAPTNLPAPRFTVAVCTHNRAELLRATLESLTEQRFPGDYEVLVVDNGSTDDTEAVSRSFEARMRLRYLFEGQIGLSHARNAAWRAARGVYVAYTDDDCRFPPEWLEVASRVAEERPAVFGGPVGTFYLGTPPPWFRDRYWARDWGDDTRALAAPEALIGCNLFVRRDVLEIVGGFCPDLGMSGDRVAYGEETALQWEVMDRLPGEIVQYEPDLGLQHLVRPEQLRVGWILRMLLAKGRNAFMLREAPARSSVIVGLEIAKIGVGMAVDATVRLAFRSRRDYPYFQNYLYEHTGRYLHRLGRLWAEFRSVPRSSP